MNYDLIFYSLEERKKGKITLNDNSLKGITIFTSSFDNEIELKQYLIDNHLMPIKYEYYKLGILSPKSHDLLPYGITYKSDLKYFNTDDLNKYYDINYIKEYFINNLSNVLFMEKFINEFYDYLIKIPVYYECLNFLKGTYINLKNNNYLEEESTYYIQEFLKYFTTRKTKNGRKNNFTNTRYLAMFIHDYEDNLLFNNIDIDKEKEHLEYLLSKSANTYEDICAYTKKINELEMEIIRKRNRG